MNKQYDAAQFGKIWRKIIDFSCPSNNSDICFMWTTDAEVGVTSTPLPKVNYTVT